MAYELTKKQSEALTVIAGDATHICLAGGSRSGKSFLLCRCVIVRALKAPNSRHAVFRFRFNALKSSIVGDTFATVMRVVFPEVKYELNKTDYYVTFPNGSQIFFCGLDDAGRAEKILGMEFVTVWFNECSEIPLSSINIALTRLAQKAKQHVVDGQNEALLVEYLAPRAYYDLNPPSKAHWSYKLFVLKRDPSAKRAIAFPDDYVIVKMNPEDNAENISDTYMDTLRSLPAYMQQRFVLGEWADDNPNALFSFEKIEENRVITGKIPDFIRIVIGVDPSGAGEGDTTAHDAIGIIVCALGTDGAVYLLEDCTVSAPPVVWGRVAATAFDRHQADCIVGEVNYGGAMVNHVIQTARPNTPYKAVTATRGKHVRAEPISALYDQGKVRHVGYFPELEDELCAFSTTGYLGQGSPNRADALIWCIAELFRGVVNPRKTNYLAPSTAPYTQSVPGMGY